MSSHQLGATQVQATHRGLHKFRARHSDEVDIHIGDPVYVEHEPDDCWCEGTNLRTQRRGFFPSAYVVDIDYDFDQDGRRLHRERYVVNYLGSVETASHKGEQVVCAAVERARDSPFIRHFDTCTLEISDQGLHLMDKGNKLSEVRKLNLQSASFYSCLLKQTARRLHS